MNFIDLETFRINKRAQIAAGQYEAPLIETMQIAEMILNHPRAQSRVFSSDILDDVCIKAGEAAWAQVSPKPPTSSLSEAERPWLFIATYMYPAGGHTKVMEDYIKLANGRPCVVLLTNLGNGDPVVHREQLYVDEVKRLGARADISVTGGVLDKLRWLQEKIVTLNPAKTFLFNHYYDSVALAASVVVPRGTGYFLHHADYKFSLGVQAAHLNHIDFHAAGLCLCRDKLKVPNQVYWPLSATDYGARTADDFYKNGRLTTASSGAYHKYTSPYPYSYADLIPHIISATDGCHVHIGELPAEVLAQIASNLAQHGIPRERLIYVPVVPSIWQAMSAYGVDVYLPSFPTGGNKATIEVMGSGTPVVSHLGMGPFRFILGGDFAVYTDALRWKHPDELFAALRQMNYLEVLQQHRLAARANYDLNYAEHFTRALIHDERLAHEGLHEIQIDTVNPEDVQDFIFNEHYKV
ncbi:hypothetical protein [Hydromonas duriensis]|uniref:Glycosyltransferase involved in cell wall biosynthesis n=1 Tax=Hydromonas duriensis TaxID=1527608 RepID=A0A4R6YAA1_9BURK|nr:hypothetical protein [Hydromonas duriensis]TDR32489.1 hypothetical protein DFR44_1032 [Hydromonas duriensis]